MTRLLLAFVLWLVLIGPPADAAPNLSPGLGPTTTRVMTLAYDYWDVPYSTHIDVRFRDLSAFGDDTMSYADGTTVTFRAGARWARHPREFCATAIHEVGHVAQLLRGEPMHHSQNSDDVMFYMDNGVNTPRVCK
jgi:hypothetical protein